jgi:2',3'-cyclic-nucleotide 2'-phosphodiesterase (5'-nucleotidase family)
MRSCRAALVLFGLAFLLVVPAPAQPSVLTLLHFNDVYQLTAVGRAVRVGSTVVKTPRAQEPVSLLLFAGDLISPSMESSLFKGAQLIAVLIQLKVDAATFGNHEFRLRARRARQASPGVAFPLGRQQRVRPGLRPFPG